MAQMQESVHIARPLEEVFAFAANPGNDARWGSNLVEATVSGGGQLWVGTGRYHRVIRYFVLVFDRSTATLLELTEYDDGARPWWRGAGASAGTPAAGARGAAHRRPVARAAQGQAPGVLPRRSGVTAPPSR